MENIKFEYVLTLVLVAVLSATIFINVELSQSALTSLTALISALSGVTGFMYGKHIPTAKKEKNMPPVRIDSQGQITNRID